MAAIFGENVKTAILKGIEALGKSASSLAEGAQKKLDEIGLETRRREVLSEIPKCVRALHQQGVELPQELTALLDELSELEEKISAMKPQPAPEKTEEEPAQEECAETCCEEEAEAAVAEAAQEAPAAETAEEAEPIPSEED